MPSPRIQITIATRYWEERSQPGAHAFAYTITIANTGEDPAQLISRHWVITNGRGEEEHVKGLGVVGHQPRLVPGQQFEYTSFCVLPTPHGTMHGSYQMVRDDGAGFDVPIEPFLLALPDSLN